MQATLPPAPPSETHIQAAKLKKLAAQKKNKKKLKAKKESGKEGAEGDMEM